MTNEVDDCFAVALTKDICPCCGKESDGAIVLNTVLTPKRARQVREMHGKPTAYKMCNDCQTVVDNGGVWLIETDPTKSTLNDDGTLNVENAHRTGRMWAVKREACERIFRSPAKPLMFIDPAVAEMIGVETAGDDDVATVMD